MKTGAIIILFQPHNEVLNYIKTIKNTFDVLVLYNNGISMDLNEFNEFNLIGDGTNEGIGTAINKSVKFLQNQAVDIVFFFDQDSRINESFKLYIEECKNVLEVNNKLILGASYSDQGDFDLLKSSSEWIDEYAVITSGKCISIEYFISSGGYKESWFIDLVDVEFCLRIRLIGGKILRYTPVVMSHSIGEKGVHNFFNIKVKTTNHNSLRLYYLFRNSCWLIKGYVISFPFLIIKYSLKRIKQVLKILFFEKQRKEKLKSILKGIVDGVY
ncbi:MAG: hypothetical protein HQ480_02515 [Candidatus Pelagibacter sp.]|nr:hypothetical protein [Candidatus Pelagibacter sp.]